MAWDRFHNTFFFRRINCFIVGRNTHSFLAFLFLLLNSGAFTTQPTPSPNSWDPSRIAEEEYIVGINTRQSYAIETLINCPVTELRLRGVAGRRSLFLGLTQVS